MAEFFAALRSGITFDKGRFGKEMDLFKGKETKKQGGRASGAAPAPLDFFKSAPVAAAGTKRKAAGEDTPPPKGKRNKKDEEAATGGDSAGKKKSKKKSKKGAQGGDGGGDEIDASGVDIFSDQVQGTRGGIATSSEPEETAKQTPIEAANLLRKQYRIKVVGGEAPPPLRSWSDLETKWGAAKGVMDALDKAGFDDPTAIQRQAIPCLMTGRELLACAPTGSGKTLAFAMPTIMRLKEAKDGGVRAVVLSPTRELAAQSHRQVTRLLDVAMGKKSRLRTCVLTKSEVAGRDFSKVDLLIATPLRLAKLIEEGRVSLALVEVLILDEADKLFEMGFLEQIDSVVSGCTHKDIQRALFSATLPEQVEDLARSVLQQPLRITVGTRNSAASSVEQKLLFVGTEEGKLLAIRQLMADGGTKPPIMVFVQSKERAKQLHRELMFDGVNVDVVHADRSQAQRNEVVDNFRAGRIWVLIATDVMSRGMDFIGVNCVVNYDFPTSVSSYIHRIGRSGRAGRAGTAVTLYTHEDAGSLRSIANVMHASGCVVPAWMLQLKKERHRNHKKGWVKERKDISTVSKFEKSKRSLRKQAVESSKKRKGAAGQ